MKNDKRERKLMRIGDIKAILNFIKKYGYKEKNKGVNLLDLAIRFDEYKVDDASSIVIRYITGKTVTVINQNMIEGLHALASSAGLLDGIPISNEEKIERFSVYIQRIKKRICSAA